MMRSVLLAGVAVLGWTGAAQAIVTQYTSQAAFNAAAPGLTVNIFSGLSSFQSLTSSPYIFGPLTFTSSGSIYLTNDGDYGTGVQYVEIFGNGGLVTIGLKPQRNAISFNVGTYGGPDTVDISINGVAQLPILSRADHPTTTFVGFTDTDPITNLSFSSATRNELDFTSFQIGRAATSVPEPASLALLGMGMGGIAAARRRRVR